jgi:putative oxidoreductase
MSNNFAPLLSLVGRVLLAILFVLAALGKIGNAAGTAAFMASGGLPAWPALAVLVGVFEIVAGLALAAGIQTRLASLALAAFTAVATFLFHAFWAAPPDQQFVQQLLFLKNAAIVGGLLFVAAFGPGEWSIDKRRATRLLTLQRRNA